MKRFCVVLMMFISLLALSGRLDGKLIVVDPGHGGPEDRGAVTESGLEEAVINLKVALYLRDFLESEGAIVVMTRTTDRSVSLKERVEIANKLDADLFLCLHHNYMETNPNADFSIVYFPSRSMDYSINLAHILAEKFEKYVGTKSGDIGPGDVYVMRKLKVPGILGEPCLMSNPEREKWLKDDENLKKEAKAYFEAVLELFSLEIPVLSMDNEEIHQEFTIRSNKSIEKAWAYLDGDPIDVEVVDSSIEITVPPKVDPGEKELTVFARSKDGVYSKPLRKLVRYFPIPDGLKVDIFPKLAPAILGSYYVVEFKFFYGGRVLEITPEIDVSSGFYQLKGSEIFVPYMGKDKIDLSIRYGDLEKKIELEFQGDEKVRILILKDKNGKIIDTIEYRGGRIAIDEEGYERVFYESRLEEPVSFETIVLKRTLSGMLKGKKIGIAYHPDFEMVARRISTNLKNVGCDVESSKISNMRDEFRTARKFNKKDLVILVGPENWNTRLFKFLKVPYLLTNSKDGILEKIARLLSR